MCYKTTVGVVTTVEGVGTSVEGERVRQQAWMVGIYKSGRRRVPNLPKFNRYGWLNRLT